MLLRKPKWRRTSTAVQTYQYFRDISWWLLNHDAPLMLGRPGVVVHIDESLFRHKPKVWYSCMASSLSDCQHFYHDILQNHCGRPPPRQATLPARGVMRIVPDRSAATLLPIIQQHVHSGTIVHSDQWAAYNSVQQLPSVEQHRVVNHSLHFVDPATSVHAQHAEFYWNRVKTKFKRIKGVHENMLDEFMWRERHGSTTSTALSSLCHDIAIKYPV